MKLVLDTSVIVAGLRSDSGASYQLIELARRRSFELLATPALFLEYEEVAYRASH